VLPSGAARDVAIAADDVEPFRFAKVWMLSPVIRGLEDPVGDVAEWEVGDGVATRFEEEHGVVASGDDAPTELDAHSAA